MPRLLAQLKTHELKAELGKRKLPTTGAKTVLEDRLREALLATGHDTETFEFDYSDNTTMETSAMKSQDPSNDMMTFMQQLMAKMDDQTKNLNEKLGEQTQQTKDLNEKLDEQTKQTKESLANQTKDLNERLGEQTQQTKELLANQTKDLNERLGEQTKQTKELLANQTKDLNERLDEQIQKIEDQAKQTKKMEELLADHTKSFGEKLEAQSNRIQSVCGEFDQLRKEFENVKSTGIVKTEVTTRQGYKAPAFDGQTSWTIYKTQFEAAARNNNWTEHERATALILALRGSAAEVLQTIPLEQQTNLGKLTQALDLRYGNDHMKQIYRTQLRNRIQKPGETLQQLQQDIERLTLLSYPNSDLEHQNETATEAFINAVQDRELQQALRLADKWTTKDALAYALTYEAAKQASRNTIRVRELTEECVCQRAEVTNEREQRGAPRCWNCDRVGHLSRNCRQPRKRNYCPSCAERQGEYQIRDQQQRVPPPINGAGNA